MTSVKNFEVLRFYPISKLMNYLTRVSWMLAENMRFLNQTENALLLTAIVRVRVLALSYTSSPRPNSPE